MYLLFYIFERLKLILLMKFCLFVVLSLLVFSACKKNEIVKGCTNGSAVNYNPEAKHDDGSCHFQYYESDSIESALLSPEIINKNYNFPMFKIWIAVKNTYNISSNYGYEGEYYNGSAFQYACSNNTIQDPLPSANFVYINDCKSVIRYLNQYNFTEGVGVACTYNVNFDCDSFNFANINNNLGFIRIGKITSGDVNRSQGYEFKFNGLSDIGSSTNDSLIFGFHRGIRLYIKKAISSDNIYTFSADELDFLSNGKGYVEVIGMNQSIFYSGSIPHILMNQTIRTKKVNFY